MEAMNPCRFKTGTTRLELLNVAGGVAEMGIESA